jgi:uncharacterized membrane protein YphA (DoxX/SURF4 family)
MRATTETLLPTLRARALVIVTWPFVSQRAAPIWFALRLYIGWIFLQFSIQKFSAGWLTSDPVGRLLGNVAAGRIPVPLGFYRDVAGWLVEAGTTRAISFAMPFAELAVALAMFSGVMLVPAALGGVLLNLNILLSGTGALAFDGRMIGLALLILLAHQVAGRIGIEPQVARMSRGTLRRLHLAPQPAPIVRRRR